MGSWDTERLYVLDPATLQARKEIEAPGRPYGIVPLGDELRVVIAHGEEDDRYFYRVRDGAFDLASKTPCPDLTGSFMTARDSTIYLGQMHYRRILEMDADYKTRREIALPTRCAGFAFGPDGRFYMISTDDEFENLQFGTLDVTQDRPRFESISAIPEEARYLLHDGSTWWTSLRDANEIATFAL
ncbi:MAG: hypothetical protein JO263_05485 [Candidatus Eremiobacteraeota bacterium]|nr:hypothetical protein [Candidatus Eremiobacteraeota bacterium]